MNIIAGNNGLYETCFEKAMKPSWGMNFIQGCAKLICVKVAMIKIIKHKAQTTKVPIVNGVASPLCMYC